MSSLLQNSKSQKESDEDGHEDVVAKQAGGEDDDGQVGEGDHLLGLQIKCQFGIEGFNGDDVNEVITLDKGHSRGDEKTRTNLGTSTKKEERGQVKPK